MERRRPQGTQDRHGHRGQELTAALDCGGHRVYPPWRAALAQPPQETRPAAKAPPLAAHSKRACQKARPHPHGPQRTILLASVAGAGYIFGMRCVRTMLIFWVAAVGPFGCDSDDSRERPAAPATPTERIAPPLSAADLQTPPEEVASSSVVDSAPATTSSAPATEPASQATQPAESPPFHPLADATLGEWAVYQALESQRLRYEIREVGLSRVKTLVSVTMDGRPMGMPANREDRRDSDPLTWQRPAGATRQLSRTTITAAGRDWDATLYDDRWTDEGVSYIRKTWVSDTAPVFGIIRMELTGDNSVEARLELVEAGRKE